MGDYRPPFPNVASSPFGSTERDWAIPNGSTTGLFGEPARAFPSNVLFGQRATEANTTLDLAQIRAQLSRIETILLEYFVHAKPDAERAGESNRVETLKYMIDDLRKLTNSLIKDQYDVQAQLEAMRAEMDKMRKERE